MYFISNNIYRRLRDFLNSKKQEIKDGKFIPIRINIILENEIFKNIEKKYLQEIVRKWLRKNTKFKTLIELKEYYLEGNLPNLLKKFLLSKKERILKGDFIPTLENVSLKLPKIKDMKKQSFYNIVRWWLQCNTPFKTIVDVKEKKFGPSMFIAIQEHLENRKYDILNGKYFPNIANLRKINRDLDYKGAIDVVNIWLKKVSKSKFKTIKDLINHFNPSPTLLGYTERDFTTDPDGLFTHIKNFKKILGNVKELRNNTIQMYKDIIISILPIEDRNSYDNFYESIIQRKSEVLSRVGQGSPKYIAGLLIYYTLFYYYKKGEKIYTLSELERLLNFGSGTLRRRSKIIGDYLKKIPKYRALLGKALEYRKPILAKKHFETYPFRQNKLNISMILNKKLRNCLRNYLNDIQEGNFPLDIFIELENRASDLKFQGTFRNKISTKLIKDYFIKKKLIRKIQRNDDLYFICKETKKVFGTRTSLGKETHPIIQNYFLNINCNIGATINPIAMEIPVWMKFKNNNDYLTGHIDLFFVFKDNTLIVADLKPKCDSQILASIPQIMAYGIMIRKRLCKYGNIKAFKTLCIGFCKNSAWSFDPEQLKGEIIKFLKYEKRWSKREKTIESYKNISKLVSIL